MLRLRVYPINKLFIHEIDIWNSIIDIEKEFINKYSSELVKNDEEIESIVWIYNNDIIDKYKCFCEVYNGYSQIKLILNIKTKECDINEELFYTDSLDNYINDPLLLDNLLSELNNNNNETRRDEQQTIIRQRFNC